MDHGTTTRQTTGGFRHSRDVDDAHPAAPAAGSHRQPRVLGRHAPGLVAAGRRADRSGSPLAPAASGPTRRSRMRPRTCGPGTWSGRTGCTARRSRRSRPTSPARPVIYPPIGALADSIGGLTGARILSLVFMLGATTLLWGTAQQLYGRRAAFFAAALFAVSGPTLHLGAFATYDAMSVFLIALAAWCVVRAEGRAGRNRLDGRGGSRAGAGQCRGVFVTPCSTRSCSCSPLLTAFPKPGGKIAARRIAILADRPCRAAAGGIADRREHLPRRVRADHAGAGSRRSLRAHRADRRLVMDRPHHRPGRVRRHHQLGRPAGTRADLAAGGPDRRRDPRARSSRRACTPSPR